MVIGADKAPDWEFWNIPPAPTRFRRDGQVGMEALGKATPTPSPGCLPGSPRGRGSDLHKPPQEREPAVCGLPEVTAGQVWGLGPPRQDSGGPRRCCRTRVVFWNPMEFQCDRALTPT